MPRKLTKSLTNEQAASELGWRDIKPWGGRGTRGIHPERGGYESIPRFTTDIRASIAECVRRGVIFALTSYPDGTYSALVGTKIGERVCKSGYQPTPSEALLAALLKFVKDGGR